MNSHICCVPAGTEYLEPTDFGTVWNLVSGSVRERRETREALEQQRKDDEVKVKLDALKVKQKRPSLVMEAVQVRTQRQSITIGSQWPHGAVACTSTRTRTTPVCTLYASHSFCWQEEEEERSSMTSEPAGSATSSRSKRVQFSQSVEEKHSEETDQLNDS